MRFTARLKIFFAAVIVGIAMNAGKLHAAETVFYSNIVPSVITLSPVYNTTGMREWADDIPFSGSHVVSSFRFGYRSYFETDPPFKATFRFYGLDPVTGLPGALVAEITRELPAGEHPLVTIQLDPAEQFVFTSEPGLYYSGTSGGWFSVQYEPIGTPNLPTFLATRHARGTSYGIMYNITDQQHIGTLGTDGFVPSSFYLQLLEGGSGPTLQTDLSLTIQDNPRTATLNEPLTYTLTATNIGTDATGVTLTDTLPPSVTLESVTTSQGSCTPTTTGVDCALGNMADGTSATVVIVVIPNVAATIWNNASVSANEDDPTLSNNSVTRATLVQDNGDPTPPPPPPPSPTAEADLDVNLKDSPDPIRRGQQLTYTATVSNDGPGTAESVGLADALPSSVNFVSASASQGSCSGSSNISCQLGDLANGESAVVTIVVIPTEKKKRMRNVVKVTSQTPDPDSDNNKDRTKTRVRR